MEEEIELDGSSYDSETESLATEQTEKTIEPEESQVGQPKTPSGQV
jgi:hypothetical protein